MRLAVLMTCHNRKTKTLACLRQVLRSSLPSRSSLDVFLVDDGSTDGTELEVVRCYPQVTIFKGDGNLYWNGGMRVAFAAAMLSNFDYYLWLNDDTMLYPGAIQSLIATSVSLEAKQSKGVIVVGSTQDADSGQHTYGGVERSGKLRPLGFRLVPPGEAPVECETMNGNCVLIPNEIAHLLGNLEPMFVHTMGDLDYGLRARRAGFAIWVMPGFAGACSLNSPVGSYRDASLPIRARLRKIMGPKGLPLHSWHVFTRRHAGLFWPLYWLWPYARVVMTGVIGR
jgi:GT2 family glycosyltransferase